MDRGLLSFFFGVALLLFLGAVSAGHRTPTQQLTGLIMAAGLLAVWIVWLRRPGPTTSFLFAVVAFAAFTVANSPVSVGVQWVTLIVLLLGAGPLAARAYGVLTVAYVVGIHLVTGSPVSTVVTETLAAVLLVVAGLGVAAIIHDRQRAHDELQEANSRLRESLRHSRELALSQERERISASLHDGLGHRLTTIGLSLDFAARMIDRDPVRARAEVHQAREATSAALDVMRSTVRALRPVELLDADLATTLRRFAASFDTTGLTVTVDVDLPHPPTEPRALLILRAVQEALTNVVRHADADRVHVAVRGGTVTVADNGPGNEAAPSFGLRGLQEAAAARGGALVIDPHGGLDGGSLLTLTLPEEP